MILVSNELKSAFSSADLKRLLLTFDDGTVIDNADIALEEMELEQSISEEEVLRFGGINSACFKVKVKGTTKQYKNLWFNASLNVGDYSFPLGRFLVNSDVATSDRQYRDIVAYDSLFTVMNKDISEWYNGLTFPISIYDMRNSLFEYLGIEQLETELINDDYMVDRTLDGNGITGHKVLSAICELNAVFGVINAYGQFKYVQINNLVDSGLFPSEDLYPSDDLYPQDIYDDCLSKADYKLGSLAYEEFDTKNITKVQIREVENDLGVSVGEDGNTYVIEDNFLVYGDTEENLTVVAQNIFDYAKHLTYTPASLKCNGNLFREVGDMIQVYADDRVFHMPIMNRVLKGIQALTDTYSAQGRETYEEQQEVGYKAELRQLKSRTNVLTRSLDETKSTITRIEDENNQFQTEVTQSFEEIDLKVSEKVSADELVAQINLSKGTISLTGNRVVISSTYFNLTANGKITATGGTIGGWNIGTSAIYKGTNSMTSTTAGTYLGTDGIRQYSSSSAYVNIQNGIVKANGVDIGGKVKLATGSSIGVFNTDDNSIFAGSWGASGTTPPSVFMCSGSGNSYSIGGSGQISGWAFGAGSNFGVTNQGAMYCRSGLIGNWSISENGLTGTSASANRRILLSPQGTSVTISGTTYRAYIVVYNNSSGAPIGALTESGWKS